MIHFIKNHKLITISAIILFVVLIVFIIFSFNNAKLHKNAPEIAINATALALSEQTRSDGLSFIKFDKTYTDISRDGLGYRVKLCGGAIFRYGYRKGEGTNELSFTAEVYVDAFGKSNVKIVNTLAKNDMIL